MPEVELVLDCRAAIGESPTWFAPEQALYWIDVKAPALNRLTADGTEARWDFEADIGAFALLEGEAGALVALRTGIKRLHFETSRTTLAASPPFDPNLFRFNEGICDEEGRFWVGAMFDPLPGVSARPSEAPIHRFSFSDGLVAGADRSTLHNGFSLSAAENAFFLSHSREQRILRAPYDRRSGTLGEPAPFVQIKGQNRVPDGAAMDEEGGYWCAIHGGGALHRYDPSGRLTQEIVLPVSQPTMCAFVGPRLDEMIVTSARDQLSPDQLKQEPCAGGLFRLRPGVRGAPKPCVVR
jgi:sugar lactone lactonase YvrE